MPQFVIIALAGAGLYAGYRMVTRQLAKASRAADDLKRRAAAAAPKDLGSLEFDADAKVYRPARR